MNPQTRKEKREDARRARAGLPSIAMQKQLDEQRIKLAEEDRAKREFPLQRLTLPMFIY